MKVAEKLLVKRRSEVAMNTHFPLDKPRIEYEHLSPAIKKQTVDLIGSELEVVSDSPTDTPEKDWHVSAANLLINGGADGTRTRDLRRDRPAF